MPEVKKTELADSFTCPSLSGFNRVRKVLVEVAGIDRSQIKPGTNFEDIIPESSRNRLWEKVVLSLGVDFDYRFKLRPSKAKDKFELYVAIIGLALLVCMFAVSYYLILPFVLLVIIGDNVCSRWSNKNFPPNCNQVKDLIWYCKDLYSIKQEYAKKELFVRLKFLLVTMFGLKPEEVTHDARFYQDLGLG